ncbi:MAG: efflux RND transporter periplasmic adaptor subunit [Elainella sp. C42_A2020_010]|nr:efflux RND transporter periplasmic adaptor subunit [Elainella sp. C42_A2020_010]
MARIRTVAKINLTITRQLLSSVLLVSLLTTACSRSEGGPPGAGGPQQALPVKVVALESGQVEESSEFVGTLEAAEKVTLQPQTQGRIERVFVTNGDRVNQGTPIVALSVDQTQADVASAQAGVSSAQAALGTAQAQLQTAEAERARAAADLQLQQSEFSRTQTLVTEGAQSQQQLDIARRNLDTAKATLAAADKQVSAARASVGQAQASVKEAQARVASARVDLGFKQVTSPINGIVGDFPVKVGDYVTPQTAITTITRNNELDMRISVPSNYSDRLRTGLPVQLIDPNSKQPIGSGSIYFVSPQIDANAQSILTKARFPNGGGNLRDGQYVQARIVWSKAAGMLVPSTAITRVGGQAFVFVVDEKPAEAGGEAQPVVSQRPVKLGNLQGNDYVVLEGLKPGDKIATTNILKLSDGAPIQPET